MDSLTTDYGDDDSAESIPAKRDSTKRASSLDAFRGLAILGMVLSGLVPFWRHTLPAWMYHAQKPPPLHVFQTGVLGMTWVDLVFPMFLFALGAAIPLAFTRRMDAGSGRFSLLFSSLWRGCLLLFFALYEQHLEPGLLHEHYGHFAWLIGIVALIVLFPIFTRLPESWAGWIRFLIRMAGWGAAIAILASVRYADGSGFTVHRHDPILVILANMVVSTAVIWLCWPGKRYTARLWLMGLVVTMHLARRFTPWGASIAGLEFVKPMLGDRIFNGLIWACDPRYQKFLLITLPGTIAGDILTAWLRPGTHKLSFSIQNSRWSQLSRFRCALLGVVCLAMVICCITGLYLNDWLVTGALTTALALLAAAILYSPSARGRMKIRANRHSSPRVSALMFRSLFMWGVVWLLIGLSLYPYQGGLRKEPPTLSFLFVAAGLSHLVLICFAVVTEAMHRPRALFLLMDNGKNPMIAYVAAGMFVLPVLHLIPVGAGSAMDWLMSISQAPWAGFARALGLTLATALFVSVFTRLHIFWRT